MYLAMLAGGQVLKKIMKRTLGLTSDDGLAIFDVDVANRTELRREFKERINELALDRETKERIILEKIRCFQLNNAIANNVQPTLRSYERLMKLVGMCVIILIVLFWLVSRFFFA